DEVPLFDRYKDVGFLGELPVQTRGELVFETAADELERVSHTLDKLEEAERFFLCLTFSGWSEFRERALCVPSVCLFVSPRRERELPLPHWRRPQTTEALLVEHWRTVCGRASLAVAEPHFLVTEEEPMRV